MNTLEHRNFVATVEIDEDGGFFHGRVINTRDVLTFQGKTVAELKTAFADTIADYEEWCKERGELPEKPYSGRLLLRLPPELHCALATAAVKSGQSLNRFVTETLARAAT